MVNKLKIFNKDRKESLEVDSHTLIVINFIILLYLIIAAKGLDWNLLMFLKYEINHLAVWDIFSLRIFLQDRHLNYASFIHLQSDLYSLSNFSSRLFSDFIAPKAKKQLFYVRRVKIKQLDKFIFLHKFPTNYMPF
jgi:hypothetical protein